jgi:hypothetical protein
MFMIAAGMCLCAESIPVRAAREKLESVRKLAGEGAASRKQVEQAELALRDARDDETIADLIDAQVSIEDLTEEQSSRMTSAARRRLDRELKQLEERSKLVSEGVLPRAALAPLEEEVARARRMVATAEERARSLNEIAAMIRAEEEAVITQAVPSMADGAIARITRFKGDAKFSTDEFKKVVLEFEKKFDRKLPVSARGETALHRSMGFDHSGRVDVAVNPEGVEGRWLMRYLEQQRIPFFAFTTAVRGQATAPHIHIGPPSVRVRTSD